jgi:hypothetical protein
MSDQLATGDIAAFLHEGHADMRTVVAGLPVSTLDWKPGEETNSIAALVVHALDAERHLSAAVANLSLARDREAAFRAAGLGSDELMALIDATERDVDAHLGLITPDRLEATIVRPNRTESGARWLIRAAAHSREHVGQATLTRQLAEQRGVGVREG